MGESWRPIFDKYLSDKGGIWVMPILSLVPVVLVRMAEMNAAKKEREMKQDFGIDEKQDEQKRKKAVGVTLENHKITFDPDKLNLTKKICWIFATNVWTNGNKISGIISVT